MNDIEIGFIQDRLREINKKLDKMDESLEYVKRWMIIRRY